jgi:hypothetical protein
MRATIVNPYKKGKSMKRKRVVRRKPVIRTARRKRNPARGKRKLFTVAGKKVYRQRPVYYTESAEKAKKKLGRRSARKKLNPRRKKGVYVMARKRRKVRRRRTKSNPITRLFKGRRRRVRRNPGGSEILQGLLQGVITSGTMIGGLYAGKMIADMIAGSGATGSAIDESKKAKHRNASRAIMTIAAAVLLPKFLPKYSDAVVSGLMAATTIGFLNTSFGVSLQTIAGDSPAPGLLYGGPSFDMSSDLQLGLTDNMSELFGVSDLSGVNSPEF